ncbi:MAG: sigma 54-interacting transcriptional regulator [Labilithrix sp.]|nr:sigma 54-interacting transcriptional regulator [Labilithrix sp.]
MAPQLAWAPLERVGEGATATVFRARRADGQLAALKIARANGDEDAWVGREAALLAGIDRRWGPALLDAGVVPEAASSLRAGARYVATTWVEGEPLASVARRAKTVEQRRELALIVAHGVARALDELHVIGVRHGDVKPANVIVSSASSPKAPWKRPACDRAADRGATLIDMGLAGRVTGEAAAGGTPRYLAPELVRGEAASPSADLHALGIVIAEVLDPRSAEAEDPLARLEAIDGEPMASWIRALTASAPGARPSAAWIASRAAKLLGLDEDEEEIVLARRARVKRAYMGVRAREIAPGARIEPAIAGPPRRWLEDAIAFAARLHAGRGGAIAPLDALGTARWIVALVGPPAAAWPRPRGGEGEIAERLLALASEIAPEAWGIDEVFGRAPAERPLARGAAEETGEQKWIAITRGLLAARPDAALMDRAENDLANAPASVIVDLAGALVRRGEIGRAFAAVASAKVSAPELSLLRAEIGRRRGDPVAAERAARAALERATGRVRDDARALIARLAWDAGDLARAEAELGDATGAVAAEVRGLVAYARGDHDRGARIVEEAAHEAEGDLSLARLSGTRGMLEHARGRAQASLAVFERAVDLATRAGAIVEEATYLTGLAAAAVDAGAVERALVAATRAALLWERLARPALAARALLSRAAAFALVGASHDADEAALVAIERAEESGDRRAAAFARWAIVETRAPGDDRARAAALAAHAALASGAEEDRVRSAARLLVWADGASVEVAALDERVASCSATARWEWWGARASTSAERRVVAEIVALLDAPAPLGSRGTALAAAARVAAELGDGDVARRLETARREAASALRDGCPPEHVAALATVTWARTTPEEGASSVALPSAQVEQLDVIVRALASRDRLKPLLEQVLDTMVLWTGVERGLLLLRAPDGGLVPRAARNLARRDLRGEQLALSTGLAKRAMEERRAICATDAYAQVGDLHASVHALRLRSVLAVPLVARGDVLGVVYLDDRVRRGAFGSSELAWVRLVASQAALAIADARDQALLRRAVRRAERANDRLAEELGQREAELATVRAELAQGSETRFRYDEIAGRSEPMRAMLRLVDRVTASEVPVLLAGESGTGKELVARAIHANGARASRSFVSENCAAVPETLLESTLFGHVRGAFTGAASTRAGLFDVADGGTLFLDEIGDMPLPMQTKLLRVLSTGEVRPIGGEKSHRVDVRIIGATHRDLEAMVAAGTFREDLFYRLNVVAIRVPPLRERAADIPLLVSHFVDKHGEGRKVKVTRAAMDRFVAFPWPGNVRQLENEIRRTLVLADDRIDLSELSDEVARGGPAAARDSGLGLKARVDALEAQLVRDALARTKGNQTRAAEALGISRFGLQKMMRRLGVRP